MRVVSQIEALRGDPARQRRAQKAVERIKSDWLSVVAAPVITDLELFGEGWPLQRLERLSKLMGSLACAREFVARLSGPMADGLAADPLAQVPIRHQYSQGAGVMQLARSGRATLSLVFYEGDAAQRAISAVFTDGEMREIILTGCGEGRRLTLTDEAETRAEIEGRTIPLEPGVRMKFACARETRLVERVESPIVLLRIVRSAQTPRRSREYRLADGALLHFATGNRRESQLELMVDLLGAMERKDAGPALARVAREGGDQLRWQALRQCLALDTRAGFRALGEIAQNASDPLKDEARALRRTLLKTYPQLCALEDASCPA